MGGYKLGVGSFLSNWWLSKRMSHFIFYNIYCLQSSSKSCQFIFCSTVKFGVFKFARKYHNLVDYRKPYVVANINFRDKQPPRKWNWEACGLFLLSSTAWKETPRVCVWSSSNIVKHCSAAIFCSQVRSPLLHTRLTYVIWLCLLYAIACSSL